MAEQVGSIVVQRTIGAPPDRVFEAFTRGDLLGRWMSPVGHAEVEVDPTVGGSLRVVMVGDGRRIEHVGEFLEVQPPHRLVFTWQSDFTGGLPTRVTVELVSAGGATDLTLRHELLPQPAASSHASGWGSMLDRLAALVGGTRQEVRDGPR